MTTFIDNRKAHFNYMVTETFEAGIELLGFEVKAIKTGMGNLTGAFCVVRGGEVFIVNMNIPPYQPGNTPKEYDPTHPRRLLLNKKEIKILADADNAKGLTLVPMAMYSKGRRIKVEVAICKGKKTHDKRESIKKRDVEREIRRNFDR